jgi:parallel beta-helix repeat protein
LVKKPLQKKFYGLLRIEWLVKAVNVKKIFSSFILLSLILFLFSGSQFVNLVSANFSFPMMPTHSIEITKDGNVTGTDKIQRSGNLYTFTGDIMGNIVIFRSGIVVDGAGYTLQGNGSRTGFWLQEKHDVEIKNLHVRNFSSGMVFTWGYSSNGCTNITLSRNTIADNKYGIIFKVSGNNNVLGNIIANNTYGISITPSPNNTFRNNQLTNNKYSFWVRCTETVEMAYYINDIDESNTIDGKPIIYWVNEQDKTVPSDAGYVALVNCRNITVQNLVLANNSPGILLVATSNSHITKNHLTNNSYGIVLFTLCEQCIGNTITENTITANLNNGILSWKSENTIITGNSITNNQENGIYIYGCRGTIISGNTITANKQNGIYIWGDDSSDNTISGNQIENNENGISLEAAFNNTITGNSITSNSGWGIILNYLGYHSLSNNTIYRNDFVNNQQALYVDDEFFTSINDEPAKDNWDNGVVGNYWSNYNGTDGDGNGKGNTPYIINENNQDNHPLMKPTVIPEFTSWIILPLLLTATALIIICKQKIPKTANQQSY